ncbi:CLRN3 protein, partial [Ptilorrhoa leucosticta]|nr:CLRN3 protein [Ptilorrhoa leucosticta]
MPSRRKTSMFASAFCTCVGSFVVICVVLATPQWVSSELRFSRPNSSVTISLTYGLFSGTCEQFVDAGLQVSQTTFQGECWHTWKWIRRSRTGLDKWIKKSVLAQGLKQTVNHSINSTTVSPLKFHILYKNIIFYFLGVLILIAMILFPVSVQGNSLSEELAHGCSASLPERLGSKHTYGYSYWIMLLILFLNIASLIIIYFYDHARYSKKKEQERPIENAPKDVILF